MKYATHWALISAGLVGIAYACATPQEVSGCQPGTNTPNCDVILEQASAFEGDASVAQGGSEGTSPSGGSSGTGSTTPPAGGAAGTGSPPSGGSAGQGAAGSGQNAGAGGASGGTAGSGAGTGGAAGTGAAGTAGTAGAGGTTAQSNFNPAACDFANRTGCEAQACATACNGNYCTTNCPLIISCVAANPTCVTAQDPMCGTPFQNPYMDNKCTSQVNSSGNPATAGTPAAVALALINCLCDDTRL